MSILTLKREGEDIVEYLTFNSGVGVLSIDSDDLRHDTIIDNSKSFALTTEERKRLAAELLLGLK